MGTIVVGIDGSAGSQAALGWAREEALLRDAVVEEITVQGGKVVPALLEAARQAELLVLGRRGRGGFSSLLLGSVSQQCAGHARCPVVVVPVGSGAPGPVAGRIVVGVDGSETARAALLWAVDEARLRKATIDVVHGWHAPYLLGSPYTMIDLPRSDFERDARLMLDRAVSSVAHAGVPAVEAVLVADGAPRALLDASEGADLVVVGSRGRGGFTGLLLGSTSQQVLHHARCPVAVIPC